MQLLITPDIVADTLSWLAAVEIVNFSAPGTRVKNENNFWTDDQKFQVVSQACGGWEAESCCRLEQPGHL